MIMRQLPKIRKESVLQAALKHAVEVGYLNMTRSGVAKAAGCSDGLVNVYFGTMHKLRRAVMRTSIRTKNLRIIGQGISARDAVALRAPDSLKRAAVESML